MTNDNFKKLEALLKSQPIDEETHEIKRVIKGLGVSDKILEPTPETPPKGDEIKSDPKK
jgi:hypothetical protein